MKILQIIFISILTGLIAGCGSNDPIDIAKETKYKNTGVSLENILEDYSYFTSTEWSLHKENKIHYIVRFRGFTNNLINEWDDYSEFHTKDRDIDEYEEIIDEYSIQSGLDVYVVIKKSDDTSQFAGSSIFMITDNEGEKQLTPARDDQQTFSRLINDTPSTLGFVTADEVASMKKISLKGAYN